MKPRKRFTSRQAILDAIDEVHHEMAADMKLIAQYEAEITSLREWFALHPNGKVLSASESDIWHGKFGRLKLCKNELGIRQRSVPRHQSKLARLKLVLAEFDTQPMSFMADGSVVVR